MKIELRKKLAETLYTRLVDLYADNDEDKKHYREDVTKHIIEDTSKPLQIAYSCDEYGNAVEIFINVSKLSIEKFNESTGSIILTFKNEFDFIEHIEREISEDITVWIDCNDWIESNKGVVSYEV